MCTTVSIISAELLCVDNDKEIMENGKLLTLNLCTGIKGVK